MSLKIAIVGAGPAGCALARLLIHKQNQRLALQTQATSANVSQQPSIEVTIFESEGSINFRSQGGTLDLHEKDGQKAIRECGLWEEYQRHVRYDGEAMQIADKNYLCYVRQGGAKNAKDSRSGRPEIDRPVLREMLFKSLPEGTVRWNKKLKEVTESSLGLSMTFADGSTESDFDLIVGADGAWSKTRSLVSSAKPFYSGIAGHAFNIPDVATTHPELYKAVNRGSLFSFSDGKSIMAQQMGDGSLNCATWAVRPVDWQKTCGYDVHDGNAVKEAVKEDYSDWHPTLLGFTQQATDDVVPRDLYMLHIGHSWPHKRGVTLIGDASHLMTPFAGEGVNLAFADCLDLASAILISTDPDALDRKVADFERAMFKRSTETQQLTWDMMQAMYFTEDAPRNGIERYIIRAIEGEMGRVAMWFIAPLVYAWFFVFKLIW